MAENTLQFLSDSVRALADAGIRTWVFGGWAQELRGLCPPRPHKDIDLLYPAGDFSHLECFIVHRGFEEVRQKRFVHKRAFEWSGVLVEVFLLTPGAAGHKTNFFGLYEFEWPEDTLKENKEPPIAGLNALRAYRQKYAKINDARLRYMEAVRPYDRM